MASANSDLPEQKTVVDVTSMTLLGLLQNEDSDLVASIQVLMSSLHQSESRLGWSSAINVD